MIHIIHKQTINESIMMVLVHSSEVKIIVGQSIADKSLTDTQTHNQVAAHNSEAKHQ